MSRTNEQRPRQYERKRQTRTLQVVYENVSQEQNIPHHSAQMLLNACAKLPEETQKRIAQDLWSEHIGT